MEYYFNFFAKRHNAKIFYRINPVDGGEIGSVALVPLVNNAGLNNNIGRIIATTQGHQRPSKKYKQYYFMHNKSVNSAQK